MSIIEVLSLIEEGSNEKLQSILKDEFDELTDEWRATLLHYSTEFSNEQMIQYLLNQVCNINAKDLTGTTPLMMAVRKRNIAIVRNLLEAGADMMILNNENKSALNMAYDEDYFIPEISELFFAELCEKYSSNQKRAQKLIDAGCHLYQAIYLNDTEIVECMLKEGVSVYSMHFINQQTPLHIAVLLKKVNIVKVLLKYGSSEDDVIDNFKEVSSYIKEQNNGTAELTLEKHVYSSVITQMSKYPQTISTHCSIAHNNKKLVQYYPARNSYVNVRDLMGTTPLMMAVESGDTEIIQILLAAGADIQIQNKNGESALQILCGEEYFTPQIGKLFFAQLCKSYFTNEERAQSLIDAGCLLHQACCFKNAKIIEHMLKCGFSANSTLPTSKLSALHIAVALEDVDTVELLLEYGADINALNIDDSTPLNFIYSFKKQHSSEKIQILKLFLNQEEISLTSSNLEGLFQISPTLMYGNVEAIRIVLQSNIDFTAQDQGHRNSVLTCLTTNINPGVVEELKCYVNKFDFNVLDEIGKSPLHAAVARCNVEMAQFLLEQGAIPNCACDDHGITPLHNAYLSFHPDYKNQCYQNTELLLQHNADAQLVFTNGSNKQMTIFDIAKKKKSLNQVKPVIAHLVILKKLGVPITDIISSRINSHPQWGNYFKRCQKLIRTNVSGFVTLFKLLICDKKQMARYSGNEKLMLKLKRLSYKQNMKNTHSYYYNTIKKLLLKGIQYRRFIHEIATVICKICEDRFDKTHLVINKIIDFFDEEDLKKIHQLYKFTR